MLESVNSKSNVFKTFWQRQAGIRNVIVICQKAKLFASSHSEAQVKSAFLLILYLIPGAVSVLGINK